MRLPIVLALLAAATQPGTTEDADPPNVMLLQTGWQHQKRPLDPPVPPGLPAGLLERDAAPPAVDSPVPAERLRAAARPRGVAQAFVQLFEWSWDDVAKECEDFLGPKGYSAVLVSPPNEHVTGGNWWTRYQPVSYNLTSRSGNESQFIAMLQRCRAAGVGVYADAVLNHCAPLGGVGVAGSAFGGRRYPLYGPEDFHHLPNDTSTNCGVDNYHDRQNIQRCDLQGMPDLCTGCEHVQEVAAAYLNRLERLGVAGIRLDAAKHMDPAELGQLLARVDGDLYKFQEVAATPGEAVQMPPYYTNGPVLEFGFAMTVVPKFRAAGMLRDDLAKVGEAWGLSPSEDAIVFLDDHDTQRNGEAPLTYRSGRAYDLASVFMLAYPYGYPKVMSSYAFDDPQQGPPLEPVHGAGGLVRCGAGQPWVCEHRRAAIAGMVAWRHIAGESAVVHWVSEGDVLAFCRGTAACVALNLKASTWSAALRTSLPEGTYCDVTKSDSKGCPEIQVDGDGMVRFEVKPMDAVAFHIGAVSAAESRLEDSLPLE